MQIYPSFMPIPLVEKCSDKVYGSLMAHADVLLIDVPSIQCMPRSSYGGFGGFIYIIKVRGPGCEMHISHSSGGDVFSVHLIYLKYHQQGSPFVRHACSFAYSGLIDGIKRFTDTAVEDFRPSAFAMAAGV
jgi:hypothetical protein